MQNNIMAKVANIQKQLGIPVYVKDILALRVLAQTLEVILLVVSN